MISAKKKTLPIIQLMFWLSRYLGDTVIEYKYYCPVYENHSRVVRSRNLIKYVYPRPTYGHVSNMCCKNDSKTLLSNR